MPNELTVKFSGMCGFVPRYDIGTTVPAELQAMRMRALLVEARSNHPAHGGSAHIYHEPVLLAPQGRVAHGPGFRKEDGTFTDRAGNIWEFFLLADQDLAISGAKPEGLAINSASVSDCPATMADAVSFRWVVPIDTVSAGSGNVLADCLKNTGHSSVAARVFMTEGTVENAGFAKDEVGNVLKWGFGPISGPTSGKQAISELVQWVCPFLGNVVELTTTRFRSPVSAQVIRLLPVSTPNGLRASVIIVNLPWANILDRIVPGGPPRRVDVHYEHFYSMSGFAGPKNVLHPLHQELRCPFNPWPNVDTPLCPPTRFNPNSNA